MEKAVLGRFNVAFRSDGTPGFSISYRIAKIETKYLFIIGVGLMGAPLLKDGSRFPAVFVERLIKPITTVREALHLTLGMLSYRFSSLRPNSCETFTHSAGFQDERLGDSRA